MATAEQVLAMMEMNAIEHPYCIIDADSRKITVPDEYKLLGVESDENVERVYFKCPKIVGDGIDLSTLGLRINYQNANSQKDSYPVDELTVENEFITFSWLLSRKAVAYKGTVKFIVCAVRTGDDGMVSNEWNTTIASAEVLEGLEVDYSSIPEEEGKDFLEALIAQSQVKLMEVVEATEEAKRSAERADTAAQEANAATERANKAAQDAENVVAGKGFIATSEKGIAGGVATLDESGQVPKEQIPDISEKTVTFEMASQRAGVESGDPLAVAFGKLAKYCADLKPHVFVDPVNNLLGTDATLPLAATQGKALDEKIEGVKSDVTELNGNYEKFEWKGQLAFDDSLFSFPAVITCIRHPLWKRCDIHISCSCEKYIEHGSETYVKLFSTQVLKTACHANSIEFETSQTRAYVYSANVNHVQSNATLGRTGLHIMHLGDWFSLCRIYNNNMDFGAWGNETDGLFVSENYFHMDIWGAVYS